MNNFQNNNIRFRMNCIFIFGVVIAVTQGHTDESRDALTQKRSGFNPWN